MINILNGKIENRYNKFENDYWAVSIKELVKKIPDETKMASSKTKIKMAFCGLPHAIVKLELDKLKNLRYDVKNFHDKDFDYIIMTNRADADKDADILDNVKGCFEKVKGEDLVTVERNGLMLSTLRKRL